MILNCLRALLHILISSLWIATASWYRATCFTSLFHLCTHAPAWSGYILYRWHRYGAWVSIRIYRKMAPSTQMELLKWCSRMDWIGWDAIPLLTCFGYWLIYPRSSCYPVEVISKNKNMKISSVSKLWRTDVRCRNISRSEDFARVCILQFFSY